MISSLKIEGFRGLKQFEMGQLGRVNLLVGTNNCGKTSVLEAIYLLASGGEPWCIQYLLTKRGEQSFTQVSYVDEPQPSSPPEYSISHLFTGHKLYGVPLKISSVWGSQPRVIDLSFKEMKQGFVEISRGEIPGSVLQMAGNVRADFQEIPLTPSNGIAKDVLSRIARRAYERGYERSPVSFISTGPSTSLELTTYWSKIVLTPVEALVLKALQIVDPNIERVAEVGSQFKVILRGQIEPVPMGSMGDGMWRLFAMAIHIGMCKGGVLLVDEIDSGLHYTTMSKMWRLMLDAATQFDIQVFATTHSYDCIHSLAQMGDPSVSVQRIESGKLRAVPYDQEELSVVAERELEVR